MAKLSFTKLYTKEDLGNTKIVYWKDNSIEVKQYLSLTEKMSMANDLMAEITETVTYLNPFVMNPLFDMLLITYYTNITFTEKQKTTDVVKTYDIVKETGLIETIKENIPELELQELSDMISTLLDNVIQYRTSARATIDYFIDKADNQNLSLESVVTQIKENPELLELSRNITEAENPYLSTSIAGTKQENDNIVKMNNN